MVFAWQHSHLNKDLSASSTTGVMWQLFHWQAGREEKRGEVSEAQEIATCCYKDFIDTHNQEKSGPSAFSMFSDQQKGMN